MWFNTEAGRRNDWATLFWFAFKIFSLQSTFQNFFFKYKIYFLFSSARKRQETGLCNCHSHLSSIFVQYFLNTFEVGVENTRTWSSTRFQENCCLGWVATGRKAEWGRDQWAKLSRNEHALPRRTLTHLAEIWGT